MAKAKSVYSCSACGYESPRWVGRCPGCGAWNTLEETVAAVPEKPAGKIAANQRPGTGAEALRMKDIPEDSALRTSTGIAELDRVLGGGIVEGGLMLIGGDPGIGKSTLLLQTADHLARAGQKVLYVSGEESARQIRLRARRLGIESDIWVLSENALDAIEEKIRTLQPDTAVIDSIQTVYRPEMASAPGSVSQIRESTSLLMRLCKETGTAMFLVGHVTKDGAIAGPRVLEHMVDVVLYFEGDRQQDYRLLRAVKNRFGSVNELGVFRMTGSGMQEVENPSEELLSHRARRAGPGQPDLLSHAPAGRERRGHRADGPAAGGAGEAGRAADLQPGYLHQRGRGPGAQRAGGRPGAVRGSCLQPEGQARRPGNRRDGRGGPGRRGADRAPVRTTHRGVRTARIHDTDRAEDQRGAY